MRILATILVTAGVALALLWLGQGRLIHLPHAGVPAPASQGLSHAEVVTLSSDDGVALQGWFVPAASTRRDSQSSCSMEMPGIAACVPR